MFGKVFVVCMVLISVFAGSTVGAQDATTQQEELITVKKSDLPANLVKQIETKQEIEQYGKYVGMGKEIGIAVNESLEAVTKNAASFADTRLGKWVTFIVVYKVMGMDIIQICVGVIFAAIWIPVWIWSYKKMCVRQNYLVSDKDGCKQYEVFTPPDIVDARLVHTIFVAFLIGVTCLIIFV